MSHLNRHQIAARDLAQKLKLEESLKPKLKTLFKEIGQKLNRQFVSSRQMTSASDFSAKLKVLLESHNKKVFKDFSGTVLNTLERDEGSIPVIDFASFSNQRNRDFIEKQSLIAVQQITKTNQKEINRSIALGASVFILKTEREIALLLRQPGTAKNARRITALLKKTNAINPQDIEEINQRLRRGERFTKEEIEAITDRIERSSAFFASPFALEGTGKEAESIFLERSKARVDFIAMSETQNAAEESKDNELLSLLLLGVIPSFSNKVWTTVGDDRVRETHMKADGQEQPVGTPFIVGGQLLKRPKDSSLGATQAETARCRCSSSIVGFVAPARPLA